MCDYEIKFWEDYLHADIMERLKLVKNLKYQFVWLKIINYRSIKIGNFDKENFLGKEIIKNHIIIQNVDRFYRLIQ